MPDYETHFRWGRTVAVAGFALSLVLMFEVVGWGVGKTIAFGLGFAPATLVGATLPDIDHKDSIPRRKLGRIGLYLSPAAVAGMLVFDNPVRDTVVVKMANLVVNETPLASKTVAEVIVTGILVLLILFGFLYILDNMKHRGWLHSPITAFVVGGVFVYLGIVHLSLEGFLAELGVLGGGVGLVVGYLTHLYLDDELGLTIT